ncbi:hypothetical protein V6O07_07510, partial [Arthrospira platensis SPKY2]
QWDSWVYRDISVKGYDIAPPNYRSESGDNTNHGWFPLYPYLVKSIAFFLPGKDTLSISFYVGIVISNIAYAVAIYFIDIIAKIYGLTRKARKHLIISMILFPGAYFF